MSYVLKKKITYLDKKFLSVLLLHNAKMYIWTLDFYTSPFLKEIHFTQANIYDHKNIKNQNKMVKSKPSII